MKDAVSVVFSDEVAWTLGNSEGMLRSASRLSVDIMARRALSSNEAGHVVYKGTRVAFFYLLLCTALLLGTLSKYHYDYLFGRGFRVASRKELSVSSARASKVEASE